MARLLTLLSLLAGVVRGLGSNEEVTQLQRSCQYGGRVYVEGDAVRTDQPCLHCMCSRGSLVCYRRMCPEIVSTLPPGCDLRPRQDGCCPALVCDETTQSKEPDEEVQTFASDQLLKYGDGEVESTLTEPPGNDIDLQKRDGDQQRASTGGGRSYQRVDGPEARSAPVAASLGVENTTSNDAEDDSTTEAGDTTTAATTTEMTTESPASTTETTTTEGTSAPPPTTTTVLDDTTNGTAATALRREDADVDKQVAETTFMTSLPTTVIIPEDMYVTNITLRKNVSIVEKDIGNETSPYHAVHTVSPHLEVDAHKKIEDYDDVYDYGAPPSLPPSLPNVKIIPFVAADAVLDEDKGTSYPMQDKHLPTDNPLYSRFSPPIKTEGGFQPREPILDGPFYESKLDGAFDTTGHLQLDITSGTLIPPSITILPKSDEKVCYSDGREYSHGELLSEPGACLACVCHHGEVFCQDTKCPLLSKGCSRVKEKRTTCCGRIVCDGDEFPTVVLTGVVPPITVADGVVTTIDPFKDVIRTEPAPDLPSLIGDLKPYLFDRHSTAGSPPVASTTTTRRPEPPTTTPRHRPEASTTEAHVAPEVADKSGNLTQEESHDEPSSLLDSVLKFLFTGGESTTETNSLEQNTTAGNTSSADPPPGRPPSDESASGILKLAGCNIYGRMYRVGRIISELSTPCQECMCTEVGVQCRPLKC